MNKIFTHYLTILLLILVSSLHAKDINMDSLENEITAYNREGKHLISQKKLSELLLSNELTENHEANVLFLMATTYRSVNDYLMCIDYLERSKKIAKKSSKESLLTMRIECEFAFVYFDTKDFESCREVMKRIAEKNYLDVLPENKAYLLMQEGYILLQENQYNEAEKRYTESFAIIQKVDQCNLPVVYCKLMDLYSHKKDIQAVEKMYHEGWKISHKCGILKYKVFLAAEMERIYKEHELFNDAYLLGIKLDSLRKLEDQGNVISEMHIIDKAYVEKDQEEEHEDVFREKIGATIVAIVLIAFIIYSFLRSKRLKNDKVRMKVEIKEMKEHLDSYSQNSHFNEKIVNNELSFFNSEKLTERQIELLKLMTQGFSNKEIADELFITESTVKYHIKNIYSILDIKDRKDLFKKISEN